VIDYKLVRELLNDMIIDAAPKLSIEYPSPAVHRPGFHLSTDHPPALQTRLLATLLPETPLQLILIQCA